MVTKEILNTHPISTLKAEIAKTNIKQYSKLKKADLIELMMKTPDRFSHITSKGPKKEKQPPKKKIIKPSTPPPPPPKTTKKEKQKHDLLQGLLEYYDNKKLSAPVPFFCSHKAMAFYFLYIMKKNKNDCFAVTGKNKLLGINLTLKDNKSVRSITGFYYEKFKIVPLADLIAKRYLQCKKENKLLIIPLGLPGHSNMLIFNTVRNEMERFEPESGAAFPKVNDFLKKYLLMEINKNLPKEDKLKLVIPAQTCGLVHGFQMFESIDMKEGKFKDVIVSRDDGFCCVYSLMWADIRMQNPKLSSKQVFDKVSKFVNFKKDEGKVKFKQFVRGLTGILFEEMKKFGNQNGLSDEEFEDVAKALISGSGVGGQMERIFNQFTAKEMYDALKV